jgi:2'-5' RNA ligase
MLASIWLRLGKEQEASLGTLIQRLASSHGTLPFQPHLTVCSSQSEVAWEAAAEYVRCCPFALAKSASRSRQRRR